MPPTKILNQLIRQYPSTGRMVDEFRQDRGKGLPDWPAWCFMPMGGWYAVVSQDNFERLLPGRRLPIDLIHDVAKIAALGTWRYSQGVYRFDATFMAALADTLIVGEIPSEVLYRLPEWCIYVETPGLKWLDEDLHGFWCHLEYDINTGRSELRFLLHKEFIEPVILHIGNWTVTEAIDRAVDEAVKQSVIAKISFNKDMDIVQALAQAINPLVGMVLYICSDMPEIDDARQPGSSPERPKPTKTKNGWRMFPADKPRVWEVGKETGEKLRQSSELEQTGKKIKPHLRRAHWHGYWTGPVTEKRKFIYKWIAPTFVGGSDE